MLSTSAAFLSLATMWAAATAQTQSPDKPQPAVGNEPAPASVANPEDMTPAPATHDTAEETPNNHPSNPDFWRYKWENGRWWYYKPSNEWVYWAEGQWITYMPGAPMVGEPYRGQQTRRYSTSYRYYDPYDYYDYGWGYGYGPYGYWPSRGAVMGGAIGGTVGGDRAARAGAILGGLIDGRWW
jgi:hypothetical protein